MIDPVGQRTRRHLQAARRAARWHRMWTIALWLLPWCLPTAVAGWRSGSRGLELALPAVPIVLAVLATWRALRGIDDAWMARRLDVRHRDMDDSAALLFVDAAALGPLPALQRRRLDERIAARPPPDLRDPWPRGLIASSVLLAMFSTAAIALWPAPSSSRAPTLATSGGTTIAAMLPQLESAALEVRPPTYTALPMRRQTTLSATVPAGGTLRWSLRFSPDPTSAELVFLDGSRVPLQRDGATWTASRRIDRPGLYRIALPTPLPAAQARLQRIDVIADRPPRLRVVQPDRSLSVRAPGQRRWSLRFEADDDYAVATGATLSITKTVGSGENIQTASQSRSLTGTGPARNRQFVTTLDLAALGVVAGDDVIVQLEVSDNRQPRAQRTRSPSVILRSPPEADAVTSGLEGLLTKTMPAYFRSQRQIIIDAEALQKQKRALAADTFAKRSDGIGVDQRVLRSRYSQFLGGEEDAAPSLPTNDAPAPNNDSDGDGDGDAHAHENGSHDSDADRADAMRATAATDGGHDHDGEPPKPPAVFGSAEDVLEEFGHVHDQAEATTLLDPATRETLRAALGEMWQSEVNLRQGRPDLALPFAYKALTHIKAVQQATRIYLARTAVQPPPIDEGRRLGGDRAGLADRRDALAAADAPDPVPAAAWRALQVIPAVDDADRSVSALGRGASATNASAKASDSAGGRDDKNSSRTDLDLHLDALARWARAHAAELADPLALPAAIDAVKRDPTCSDCRAALRRALWPALQRPPGALDARPRGDRTGQAYLDALGREALP